MASYFIVDGEEEHRWTIERLEGDRFALVDEAGEQVEIDAYAPEPGRLHLLVEGRALDIDVRLEGDDVNMLVEGSVHGFEVLNERQKRMRVAGVGGSKDAGPALESPMAGKIVAVHVEVGQLVEEGDTMVIVEAMKMENDLKAHRSGRVEEIAVEAGQAVEIGDLLVRIELED